MLVYVAGSRHERPAVQSVQQRLVDMGHKLTMDWTGAEGAVLPSHAGGHHGDDLKFWANIAYRELEAVGRADFLVAVLSIEGRGRGMFIEIGAALSCGRSVFLVGDAKANDSNFWALSEVTICRDEDELCRLVEHYYG